MVILAMDVCKRYTDRYEVIVIDDGSSDASREILRALRSEFPQHFRAIFHEQNKGYGGALKSGIAAARHEWIFYTDGDMQYDVLELPLLIERLDDQVDYVQGYKIKRQDPLIRIVLGLIYQRLMKIMFRLKIKDVDCDYRILRRSLIQSIHLKHNSGVICVEMMAKLNLMGARFTEVGVTHRFRMYGRSQFFNFPRVARTAYHAFRLWIKLMILKQRQFVISPPPTVN
jgi:glycosyltransferase involved in cell wall biosynthesis